VTNITNIIYNFNLTPSQQLQQIREQQQKQGETPDNVNGN